MIHSIELENFKGIGARQRVDLAPLTLLFGANSAGKSTILQALLYVHELLERGSADVDTTELGGNVVELGGFARLVHRHETHRSIVVRLEFATPGGLERFGRDLGSFPFPDLDDELEAAWLELTVRFRTTKAFRGPLLETAAIGVAGEPEPLVLLEVGASLREGDPLYARVNLGHPLLAQGAREIADPWFQISVPEEVAREDDDKDGGFGGGPTPDAAGLGDGAGVGAGRQFLVFALSRSRLSALPPANEPLRVFPFGDDVYPDGSEEKTAAIAAAVQVQTFLEMVVLGTTAQLGRLLQDALYIGPLRMIPSRGSLYEHAGRSTSWADGLAAWDLLLADRSSLVERTNHWLRRVLGLGCQVVVQQLFDRTAAAEELTEGHTDKTVRRLLLDTGAGSLVLPSEVGAGVSQVVPVVVAALEGRGGLSLIEQPEIHVHPAVQVGFGDLFLDATGRDGGRRMMIVETHSEHLLLRVMRRLRETAENRVPEGRKAVRPDEVMVLFVERDDGRTMIRRMPLNERGELVKAWPGGFFEESLREVF